MKKKSIFLFKNKNENKISDRRNVKESLIPFRQFWR